MQLHYAPSSLRSSDPRSTMARSVDRKSFPTQRSAKMAVPVGRHAVVVLHCVLAVLVLCVWCVHGLVVVHVALIGQSGPAQKESVSVRFARRTLIPNANAYPLDMHVKYRIFFCALLTKK